MSFAEKVQTAVAAVCPVRGVSIGKRDDATTWEIDFDPSATTAQKAAARGVLRALDVRVIADEVAVRAQIARIEASAILPSRALRDLAIAALPSEHYVRQQAEAVEAQVGTLREKLR